VILPSKNLSNVIEYSPDDLYVTVGAGMMLQDVNSHVNASHLMFPFGGIDYSGTIGGAVALGISAQIGDEIVPIKRFVPSLSFVTPYGKLIRAGAVTLKCVAGYDVPKLLVGSRGQFGFITSITLRLSHSMVGQDSPKPATITPITPRWGEPDDSLSPVERNLKSNLDPHGIFPTT
jgi:FAD/FMN-containing dehydrogenase